MQYVFLIRSRVGCKKYVIRLRLVTYFLQPALERIKTCIARARDRFYIYTVHTDSEFLAKKIVVKKCR